MPPSPKPCGTRAAYQRGCRCQPCRQAAAAYRDAYHARGWRRAADARQAFLGSPYDPEKARRARKNRPRAPLTDVERTTLAELLGAW